MDKKPHSYIYYFKCKPCLLEFVVFSWEADWMDKFKPFCPECGKQEISPVGRSFSDKPIFELKYDENIK